MKKQEILTSGHHKANKENKMNNKGKIQASPQWESGPGNSPPTFTTLKHNKLKQNPRNYKVHKTRKTVLQTTLNIMKTSTAKAAASGVWSQTEGEPGIYALSKAEVISNGMQVEAINN